LNKFRVSLKMRNIPLPSNKSTPDAVMLCSTAVGELFYPPRRASIAMRSRNPPSSAGSGRMFTTARLMFMTDANWYRPVRSDPPHYLSAHPNNRNRPAHVFLCLVEIGNQREQGRGDEHGESRELGGRQLYRFKPARFSFSITAFASSCAPMRPSPDGAKDGVTSIFSDFTEGAVFVCGVQINRAIDVQHHDVASR